MLTFVRLAAFLLLFSLPALAQQAKPCGVEVTYLANEGVLLSAGGKKVLIDAAFRQAMQPYANHSPATLSRLESAQDIFAGVDIVLATHRHADHFDAASVAAHLRSNPEAIFVAAQEAVDLVRAHAPELASRLRPVSERATELSHDGITVRALPVLHGGRRHWQDPQHLVFELSLGGKRLLHAGDADGSVQNFRERCTSCEGVDVALLPYWYLLSATDTQMVREFLRPRSMVMIHVPPDQLEDVRTRIEKTAPQAAFFANPMEKRCF